MTSTHRGACIVFAALLVLSCSADDSSSGDDADAQESGSQTTTDRDDTTTSGSDGETSTDTDGGTTDGGTTAGETTGGETTGADTGDPSDPTVLCYGGCDILVECGFEPMAPNGACVGPGVCEQVCEYPQNPFTTEMSVCLAGLTECDDQAVLDCLSPLTLCE
ncbi:MAG: hypothetical protein ACI9WU_001514 [Myxococcota bacterium]